MQRPASATAMCVSNSCRLLRLSRGEFQRLMRDCPGTLNLLQVRGNVVYCRRMLMFIVCLIWCHFFGEILGPFWGPLRRFGVHLGSLWGYFGAISEWFWDHLCVILRSFLFSFWCRFGVCLRSIWGRFGIISPVSWRPFFGSRVTLVAFRIFLRSFGGPLGGHFSVILESPYGHFGCFGFFFGSILGPLESVLFSCHLRSFCGCFCRSFCRLFLRSFCDHLGSFRGRFGPFRDHCEVISGSFGVILRSCFCHFEIILRRFWDIFFCREFFFCVFFSGGHSPLNVAFFCIFRFFPGRISCILCLEKKPVTSAEGSGETFSTILNGPFFCLGPPFFPCKLHFVQFFYTFFASAFSVLPFCIFSPGPASRPGQPYFFGPPGITRNKVVRWGWSQYVTASTVSTVR